MKTAPRIRPEDITVVIQGPVQRDRLRRETTGQGVTAEVVASVRRVLPGARVVFSTQDGADVRGLGLAADEVVFSPDPGGFPFHSDGTPTLNNNNRLIASTARGLAEARTPYTLKLRSDLHLSHARFLSFMHRFDTDPPDRWQAVGARILAFPVYSLKGERWGPRWQPRPLHVSDWAYFGRTEDLQRLYDLPPAPEPENSSWFATRPKPANDLWPARTWRFSPEQYITRALAARVLPAEWLPDHASDDRPEVLAAADRFIARNFVMVDQDDWGLVSLKWLNHQHSQSSLVYEGLYHHRVWRADYERLCRGRPLRARAVTLAGRLGPAAWLRRALLAVAPADPDHAWVEALDSALRVPGAGPAPGTGPGSGPGTAG